MFEQLEREQHRQLESLKKDKKKTDSEEKDSAESGSEEKDKEEKDSDKIVVTLQEWTKYFSTHPAGEDRVETLKKLADASTVKSRPLLPEFDWKSMHRETKESDSIF